MSDMNIIWAFMVLIFTPHVFIFLTVLLSLDAILSTGSEINDMESRKGPSEKTFAQLNNSTFSFHLYSILINT